MRLLVQRVLNSNVKVDGKITGEINKGYMVLLGVTHDDDTEKADYLVKKLINLRVFEDENGKMNKSLLDVGGSILAISQFTLYADCKRGNRPGFTEAMEFNKASEYYDLFVKMLRDSGLHVETGIFGADMKIELLNDGPVTILLDTDDL